MTDDGSENITGDGLTLVIRKGNWGVDEWTEGGEEHGGGGGGKLAHGEGRGKFAKHVGVGVGSWVERVWGENWTAVGMDIDEEVEAS